MNTQLIDSLIQVIESLTPEENRLLRTKLHTRTIQKTSGVCGGHARIRDTRIPVWTLVSFKQQGADADELLRNYPGLILADLDAAQYDAMTPRRWPVSARREGGRFFGAGGFYHPGGKARLLPVTFRPPAAKTAPRYPFRLNTGRVRDQWHTMTRTALSPRLSAHLAEPFLEIHPEDGARLGLAAADLALVTSPSGRAILRVWLSDAVQPGQVFAPMHWTGETAPSARIDALVAAVVDPVSGQPESKASVVAVKRFEAQWYGFAVARRGFRPGCDYWALARTEAGYRAELAGSEAPEDWADAARGLFGLPEAELASVSDAARGSDRKSTRLNSSH